MRRINLLALCCWSLYVKTHALLYTCIHLQSVCQNCNFYGTAPLCCFCNGWGSNHKRRTGGGAGRPTHPPFPFWPEREGGMRGTACPPSCSTFVVAAPTVTETAKRSRAVKITVLTHGLQVNAGVQQSVCLYIK